MKNKYFDTVVKRIWKYNNKIIEIEKIKTIIENILDTEYTEKKAYKMIYYLKNRGYIESIKKDILFVKDPETTYTENELTEKFYREVVKKHCSDFLKSKRYIWGIKALELNMNNYSIPDEILIVNNYKQATEKAMNSKQVLFKTYESKTKNLFPLFYAKTKKIQIKNSPFMVANLELAILETLYNQSIINKTYGEELIKKIIRKYHKQLNVKIREDFIKNNKHHSTINKLYKISQGIEPTLAEKIKTIIKKYSYFIA